MSRGIIGIPIIFHKIIDFNQKTKGYRLQKINILAILTRANDTSSEAYHDLRQMSRTIFDIGLDEIGGD